MKKELTLAERLAFIEYVVTNTLEDGMEYRDYYIDYVIANYYYGYEQRDENSRSEIYEDIRKIKKENKDFYDNELMDLIKVVDKKLDYAYQKEIHRNPLNDSLAILVDTVTNLIDSYSEIANSNEVQKNMKELINLIPTLKKYNNGETKVGE